MLNNSYVITTIVIRPGKIGVFTVMLLVGSIPGTESQRCDS